MTLSGLWVLFAYIRIAMGPVAGLATSKGGQPGAGKYVAVSGANRGSFALQLS